MVMEHYGTMPGSMPPDDGHEHRSGPQLPERPHQATNEARASQILQIGAHGMEGVSGQNNNTALPKAQDEGMQTLIVKGHFLQQGTIQIDLAKLVSLHPELSIQNPLPAQDQHHAYEHGASVVNVHTTISEEPRAPIPDERIEPHLVPSLPPQSPAIREQMLELEEKLKSVEKTNNVEVRDLKAKLRESTLKNQKLHQMIINMSKQDDEPPDTDVEKDCIDIQYGIETIMRTHYKSQKLSLLKEVHAKKNKQQQKFYRYLLDQPDDAWKTEIRAWIFKILNDNILSSQSFGLNGAMEQGLKLFENCLMESSKVDRSDALDWRTRTIACAGLLGIEPKEIIELTQESLWQLLSPIKITGPKGDTPESESDIRGELLNICRKAVKLALAFRRSRTKYHFQLFDRHTKMISCEEEVKVAGSIGKTDVPFDQSKTRIHSTLFGALIKTRNALSPDGASRIVLQKAQVVVFDPRYGNY